MPPLPEPGPEKDGLFSKVYCDHGLRYVCGYRSICVATNDENVDKWMASRLAPGTIMIRIDSSAASPPNIEIICEELVFVGGTKYAWSEKSVRIRCRKISLLPDDKKPVEFDLSGRNGADPPNKVAMDVNTEEILSRRAQAPGLGVFKREADITGYMTTMKDEWNAAKYDESKPPKPAQNGRDGIKGLPGERGHDSGSFELLTEEVDESVLQQGIAFVLTCNGGKGGNGQDGQDGAEGGAGLDYECDRVRHYETNHPDESILRMLFGTPRPTPDVYNNLLHVFLGAPGGSGGNGGPGGRGGNSGSVNISPDALKAIFQITNNCGDKGIDGSYGQTGKHGKHSKSKVFKNDGWAMWSWKHYADDLDEKLVDEKKLCMVIHEWATNETAPQDSAETPVNHLVGDGLWALYEPGQQQAATVQGSVTIHDTDISDLHRGYTRDASFLQKILDRLRFEHFMHLTCQPYSLYSAQVPGPAVTQMKMSMDWMIRIFQDISLNDQSPLIRSLYLSYTALAHAYISTPAVDAFNNSISYVPWIPSADAFEKTLTDFETVEKWYNESAAILATQAQQRDVLQKKIDDARGKVFASTQEIEKQQKKATQLADLFKQAAGNVEEARQQLARAVEAFKDRIEHHVECKLETVLESLSSALMFTDAEKSAAVGGAFLSVSVGAIKTVHESFGQIGGVEKSLLIARMDVMTKASKDLKDEIAKTVNDNAQIREKEGDLRTQIIADRSKFDSMVDQYFAGIGMTEEVKKRFDLLIKAIDRKNKILTDYNGVVVDIAKARLEIHEQETLIAGLDSGKAALNDDEIQFVALFMSRAYENMGRFAIRALYSRVRAFNCVSFSPSRAFDCLSPLSSFSGVTASTLQVAVKSALQKDFQDMQARWAETSSNSKTVTMTMSEAEHPILFQQFRSKRSILLDIDWDMFRPHVGDDSTWDIRLLHVSVYLVGAKVDRSKLPPNPPPSLTTVQLHVSTTGMFRFRDRSYKTHVFELASSHTSFFHKEIPAENPPDAAFVTEGKPVKGESFQLDFLDGMHDPVPLQSPLGVWTIEPVPGVDLTDCRSIRFDFEVSYRV